MSLDAYGAMVQVDQAQVVSSSWGWCEPDMVVSGINYSVAEDSIFQLMAVQDQSMFAAAGDSGSPCNAPVGTMCRECPDLGLYRETPVGSGIML